MHPILFELPTPWGQQPIYAYGVLLGLSLLVGWQITLLLGKQADINPAILGDSYLTAAICGVVGARSLYILTHRDEFSSLAQWFDLRSGGLIAYGGMLGGFAGAALHSRIKHLSLLDIADCAAPAIAVGLFLTRIGCYLYGCDFGTRLSEGAPAWLARLGTFPHWSEQDSGLRGSPAFLHHVDAYGLPREAMYSLPVHPTQLYEALLALGLAVLCLWRFQRRAFLGQILLILCMSYGSARFLLEYLRDDPERGEALGFSIAQLISLCLVPIAAIAYTLLRKISIRPGRRASA
jgi:phosphatidylglycerol:prolipoprotein diacylglycerol transferase